MLLTLALSLGVIVLARPGRASGSALCIAAAAVLFATPGRPRA